MVTFAARGPLGLCDDLELDLVTLVESPEALGPDLRVMDENVRTTLAGEETETLGLVEPLDGTFDHERAGLLGLCLVATSPARSRNESRPPWAAPSATPEQRPTNAKAAYHVAGPIPSRRPGTTRRTGAGGGPCAGSPSGARRASDIRPKIGWRCQSKLRVGAVTSSSSASSCATSAAKSTGLVPPSS